MTTETELISKQYLGDGVSAVYEAQTDMIRLSTSRWAQSGRVEEHRIYLEPAVFAALARVAARCWPKETHDGD